MREASAAEPVILVTGATGETGSLVAERLLPRGFRVRAFVCREDARSARLAELGAEVRAGDLCGHADVVAAPTEHARQPGSREYWPPDGMPPIRRPS